MDASGWWWFHGEEADNIIYPKFCLLFHGLAKHPIIISAADFPVYSTDRDLIVIWRILKKWGEEFKTSNETWEWTKTVIRVRVSSRKFYMGEVSAILKSIHKIIFTKFTMVTKIKEKKYIQLTNLSLSNAYKYIPINLVIQRYKLFTYHQDPSSFQNTNFKLVNSWIIFFFLQYDMIIFRVATINKNPWWPQK